MKKRRKVIRVAPRQEIIRKRYARFLASLGGYLKGAHEKVERQLRKSRKEDVLSLAD